MTDKREIGIDEAFQWDARRQEILTARHNIGRSLFIDVTAWGITIRIFRDDAPKVLADLDAALGAELADIEARFRALGVKPSDWTAPKEGGQ
ncbi:MAG: hypothetical protein ACK4TP_10110 [Hyphomicrobium sp.]